jgi:hypothetical protein
VMDAPYTGESPDPRHPPPETPSARPGAHVAALACVLTRHKDPMSRGYRYDVTFEGEVIVTGSLDPEFAAARVLRDRGYTGRLQFFRMGNPEPALVMKDLVCAAGYSATLNARFVKFQAFDPVVFGKEPKP